MSHVRNDMLTFRHLLTVVLSIMHKSMSRFIGD